MIAKIRKWTGLSGYFELLVLYCCRTSLRNRVCAKYKRDEEHKTLRNFNIWLIFTDTRRFHNWKWRIRKSSKYSITRFWSPQNLCYAKIKENLKFQENDNLFRPIARNKMEIIQKGRVLFGSTKGEAKRSSHAQDKTHRKPNSRRLTNLYL